MPVFPCYSEKEEESGTIIYSTALAALKVLEVDLFFAPDSLHLVSDNLVSNSW